MSVTVNETKNTVTVNEGDTTIVTVNTQGPVGPKGLDLVDTAKVNGSVVYYDSSAGSYKADANWTRETLVFGGDF